MALSMFLVVPLLLWLSSQASEAIAQATPQTITLQSRATPYNMAKRRRALPPTSEPLADFFLGTDLQWSSTQSFNFQFIRRMMRRWFGNLSIGSPPQVLTLFDTGSSTLEFASTLCGQPCANQVQFDPSKSSTFVDGGRTSSITFATGVGVDPVVGANYRLTLRSATDTVAFGGLSATKVPLFLITNQTAKFSIDPFSGIQGESTPFMKMRHRGSDLTLTCGLVGMGATAQGIFAGLIGQGLPSLFGMYLAPKTVGNAELTLGGVDSAKFIGSPIFVSLPSGTGSTWQLASPGISVNGKTTSLLHTSRTIIFDSGTSNILFSTNTANAIYALISPDIKPNPNEPGTYGIACDRIPSLPAMIDITFTSQTGAPFNLSIPSSELSVGPFASDSSLCQTLINAFDGLELVGGSLLKHYYSIWDVGRRRLGFAPAAGV
ncbi:unnamed protein product [Cyclocybe aegerita]|uniref:Peptidase A1 domain-containing protein n=1 Tax=Cyclocybe aegerita TaxID=1973307 RepID=A0A8S0W8S9_CYCAE|nr:unnamed protein product [Cyclocybe aegerita]